ncbi:AcrR family transcriptional regulator [Streptomyces sp. SAI-133]|nr:AcrR family transcriptional regulator [Streptomyces sp. SAI-133]
MGWVRFYGPDVPSERGRSTPPTIGPTGLRAQLVQQQLVPDASSGPGRQAAPTGNARDDPGHPWRILLLKPGRRIDGLATLCRFPGHVSATLSGHWSAHQHTDGGPNIEIQSTMSRYDVGVSDQRPRTGRPRSEQARTAVLHAVDDLLVEVGYAALTMKGIAERAGVGRQTVYRWWSTKAEILFEAAITDAIKELIKQPQPTTLEDVITYLEAVESFLTTSPAGAAYRALLGEAQHDSAVAQLVGSAALFDGPARAVLSRGISRGDISSTTPLDAAIAVLTGPAFYLAVTGADRLRIPAHALASALLAAVRELSPTAPMDA